jgi:tetraacyldisaccharide 4'-kinase
VPVYVDTDREAAAKAAFADGAQVVLSDDGLQRATLPRRMELCVVDGARGFGNGRLLPAGPLREPITRLDTVDTVVINGEGTATHLPDGAVTMRLRPTVALRLDGSEQLNADELRDNQEFQALTALAGTGNPGRFFDTVRSLGLDPQRCVPFDDHHAFRPGDFAGLEGTLLMTEKDAVKCRELSVANAWYLVVDAQLEPAWEQQFLARCEAIIKQ